MNNSQYTIKSQSALEIFSYTFLLLMYIGDILFDSRYANFSILLYGVVLVILFSIHNIFKGINDELSNKILSKVNEKSIQFMFSSIIIVTLIATTPNIEKIFKSIEIMGIILMSILVVFTIFRFVLFTYYDRKGICD